MWLKVGLDDIEIVKSKFYFSTVCETLVLAGQSSAVGNMSDCRSRGHESHPGPIHHETISTAILLPSADSRRVGVSYKQKYVQEVLVNRYVKLAQEKCG